MSRTKVTLGNRHAALLYAADSCARVLFGKNFFVTAKVVRSN